MTGPSEFRYAGPALFAPETLQSTPIDPTLPPFLRACRAVNRFSMLNHDGAVWTQEHLSRVVSDILEQLLTADDSLEYRKVIGRLLQDGGHT